MLPKIACIGSRQIGKYQFLCYQVGQKVVRSGYFLATGNATGADQAFAAGANSIDPTKSRTKDK